MIPNDEYKQDLIDETILGERNRILGKIKELKEKYYGSEMTFDEFISELTKSVDE